MRGQFLLVLLASVLSSDEVSNAGNRVEIEGAKAQGAPIIWDGVSLHLLDQRSLPQQADYISIDDVDVVFDAIASMVVRGAPAIGITAAYGVALAARNHEKNGAQGWSKGLERDIEMLRKARPTAVNLAWAIDRMQAKLVATEGPLTLIATEEAMAIHREDVAANRVMGRLGSGLLDTGVRLRYSALARARQCRRPCPPHPGRARTWRADRQNTRWYSVTWCP